MNRIILTKTIVLTEFVFHLKNLSAVCTDDTHKNGRLFRGGVAYIYIFKIRKLDREMEICQQKGRRDPNTKWRCITIGRSFQTLTPKSFGYAAWQPAMPHTESVSFDLLLCQCSAESRAIHHAECETRMKRSSWCKSRCLPGVEIPTPFQSGQRNWEVFNISAGIFV